MTTVLLAAFVVALIFSAGLKFRAWRLARAATRTEHRLAYGFLGRPVRTPWLAEIRRRVADRIRYAVALTAICTPLALLVLALAQLGGKT